MPRVNPDILRWARETAGLGTEEAARRLGIEPARGVAGAERIRALEAGREEPTRALLAKMARGYRRPLVAFYMAEPPRPVVRGRDFRTLPGGSTRRDEALVDSLLRDVRARQSTVRAVLEEDDDAAPLPFVGSMRERDGIEAVLASIRGALGFSLMEFRRRRTPGEAFELLRGRAESAGVFVLLIGSLGSHHTALDVELFRGFALADPSAPFIVLNDRDTRAAWSFTLVHELVHLWLGQTGVSGGTADRVVERFCNDVASELLLPTGEIDAALWRGFASPGTLAAEIGRFAGERNLSRSMVAYRLYRQGVIGRAEWNELRERFRRQ
jgi:Zn-dependent peptidase ImmA (M78 family)